MKTISFTACILFLPLFLMGQNGNRNHGIQAGSDIPLFYSAAVNLRLFDGWSASFQGGILTKPWDRLILNILEMSGTDEALTNTIGEAFSVGYKAGIGINHHFRHFYAGLNYEFLSLQAKDAPRDLINTYYGLNLPGILFFRPVEYSLRSDLHAAGLKAGRQFNAGKRLYFRTEIAVARIFAGNSVLSSGSGQDLQLATALIDRKLNEYYLDYGWLPSLNLYIGIQPGGN